MLQSLTFLSPSPTAFSFSQHFKLLFFFLPPPTPSHLAVSFSLIPLPASTLTHSSSWISLSSPSHFPHPAFMSSILLFLLLFFIQRSFLLPASLDLCLPSVSPVFQLLSLPLYCSTFHLTGSVFLFLFSSYLSPFPSFRLPSLPLVLFLLCLFLSSVFQAHCLFSVLSETVEQAVQGSYQPQ